ncbi:hypothetical protein K1T71_001978 [Dendrolimus kikuchii]|uniref:Uncharacterized protein n=1 Tax=Dendrolimus kikuchii TaxID=765133 RepID=A0ACC1DF80_9NEOP|nr:hypothetical protein K1T71_001978 [Dendrolimus kikuchii]
MVKRPLEDADSPYGPRSTAYLRLHMRRHFAFKKSLDLKELERIADITTALAKLRYPDSNKDYGQFTINVLRQIFNLEFKLFCENCGTPHNQDEISAPER